MRCRLPQIKSEVKGALAFLRDVYSTFGFTFQLNLSTRPEKYLGEVEVRKEIGDWGAVMLVVMLRVMLGY